MNLEGYEFIERISGNTNSETWAARKHGSEQMLSIKVLTRNAVDAEYYHAIIHNANNAKEIRHTNLVNLTEIIEQDDLTYFISESINGKTIKETVEKSGLIQEKTALTIALCIAGMLETAHRKKYLSHGSVSPSHIIIDKDGIVKLAGLGLPLDKTEHSFFTAPEQTANKAQNALSDMYSMGTTIYYMLTGKESFSDAEDGTTATAISDKTIDLITKFTHTNPEKRYDTWQEALTDIEKAAAMLPNTTALPPITDTNKNEQAAAKLQKRKNPATVPLWFRSLAWLLLFGFLGCFIYIQLTNPVIDKNNIIPNMQNSTPNIENPATTELVMNNVPPVQDPQAILSSINKQVVSAILANDMASAKEAVNQGTIPEIKEQTNKLLEIIKSVSDPDLYIATIFGDNIGKSIIVIFGNRRREIIPVAISGANITAKLAGEDDSEPVTFSIKELSIDEKLRLLGPRKGETACIIKLLLNVKAGNIHDARITASSCGPLAQEFAKQLKK